MSAEEHTGEMSEWDLLVQRIRAMEDPERDSELRLRDAANYGRGWDEACDWLAADLKENKRQFGRRIEARIYREMRRDRIARRKEWIYTIAMVAVMVGALLWVTS